MGKTCKSVGCNRKISNEYSLNLCSPCSKAFESGQKQKEVINSNIEIRSPPTIDFNRMYEVYDNMPDDKDSPMKEIFGMMLHLSANNMKVDDLERKVASYAKRIERLEACIASQEEVAVPLGLVVRNMPLPPPGVTELQQVKNAFMEINAPNIDVENDVVHAVRLGATGDKLGSVMVEMSNSQSRASIMKNKKRLVNHHSSSVRKLVIKNMKSWNEMKIENALNGLLRKLPGFEKFYISSNGNLIEKSLGNSHNNATDFSLY